MQLKTLFFFIIAIPSLLWAQKKASDFEGEFIYRHSLYLTVENQTVHGVEDKLQIQPINDKEAQILIETYRQNFHSCQLVGKAQVDGNQLIFKSPIAKELNRGRKAQCTLKLALSDSAEGSKTVTVEDTDDLCKLKFCGMSAELSGKFSQKAVDVKDKN